MNIMFIGVAPGGNFSLSSFYGQNQIQGNFNLEHLVNKQLRDGRKTILPDLLFNTAKNE